MLKRLFDAGIEAVLGDKSVQNQLVKAPLHGPVYVLAIGKAAASMLEGVCKSDAQIKSALLVTKHGHVDRRLFAPNVEIIEAAHPMPDQTSLDAGHRVLQWVSTLPAGSKLLMLVSGGASSLVEVLSPNTTMQQLLDLNQNAMAQGLTIGKINEQRRAISAIKGGKLLSHFVGERAITLYISDVQGDTLGTVGSGIGSPPPAPQFAFESHLVASNAIARDSIAQEAQRHGIEIIENLDLLFDDVNALAPRLAERMIKGPKGLYIWGGESTFRLPKKPGLGGRNQHLGLLFAKQIAGREDIFGLFAGTDGTDGPTDFAGALVDGETFDAQPGAQTALDQANSGAYLQSCNAIVETGPTGTNVMDIALVLKK